MKQSIDLEGALIMNKTLSGLCALLLCFTTPSFAEEKTFLIKFSHVVAETNPIFDKFVKIIRA